MSACVGILPVPPSRYRNLQSAAVVASCRAVASTCRRGTRQRQPEREPGAMASGLPWPAAMLMVPSVTLVSTGLSSMALALCIGGWYAWGRMVKRLNIECCSTSQAVSFEDPWSTKRLPVPSVHAEPSKSLTVVFPAFNESHRMDPAIEEALEYLQVRRKRDSSFSFEIIVVDDGSADDTYRHGMRFAEKLGIDTFRVLRFPVNKGKGAAVRAGVLAARGELILFADSDGATQFSDLAVLHTKMAEIAARHSPSEQAGMFSSIADQHGFVLGSRAHLETSKAVSQRSWTRNFMMHVFHLLVTAVAGHAIHDTQCGFKVRRAALPVTFGNQNGCNLPAFRAVHAL